MAKKTYGDVHAYRQLLSTHTNEHVQCHVSSWVLRSVSATKAHKMLTLNLILLQAISKLTTGDGYQTKEWTFLNFNNNRHTP